MQKTSKLHGFMEFSSIKGISSDDKHKNCFHIESYSFDIHNEIKTPLHNSDNHANFSSISITRNVDEASSQLMACVTGCEVGDCKITFSKSLTENIQPLISITLKDAQILSYSTKCSTNGEMLEYISIHYSEFLFDYSPKSDLNKQKPGYSFQYVLNT